MIFKGDLNMINCFKELKVLYYVIGTTGAIFIIIILLLCNHSTNWGEEIFATVMWIFAVISILELFAIRKIKRIKSIMIDDCNCAEFIRICKNLLFDQSKKSLETFWLLNMSTGYLTMGNMELAQKTLNRIQTFGKNRMGAIFLVTYYNNLVAYYIYIKDSANAINSFEEMKLALNNKKLTNKYRNEFMHICNEKQSIIHFADNIFEGAEQLFIDAFERENHMLWKVYAKYTLGIVYFHDNRISEAIEAFEFAVINGGDSCYTKEAKLWLEKLT